jgi:hypothetical protein
VTPVADTLKKITVVEDHTLTFDSSGEASIRRPGYVPISAVEYGQWAGYSISSFAFDNERAYIKRSSSAGQTKTMRIAFVRIS